MVQNVALREIANGSLLIFDSALSFMFLRYIWFELIKKSNSLEEFRRKRSASLEAQMILFLFVYHFGTTIRNLYNYVVYKAITAGWEDDSWLVYHIQSHPVVIGALVITATGGFCAIRVFSKHRLTPKIVLACAVLLPTAAYFYFRI